MLIPSEQIHPDAADELAAAARERGMRPEDLLRLVKQLAEAIDERDIRHAELGYARRRSVHLPGFGPVGITALGPLATSLGVSERAQPLGLALLDMAGAYLVAVVGAIEFVVPAATADPAALPEAVLAGAARSRAHRYASLVGGDGGNRTTPSVRLRLSARHQGADLLVGDVEERVAAGTTASLRDRTGVLLAEVAVLGLGHALPRPLAGTSRRRATGRPATVWVAGSDPRLAARVHTAVPARSTRGWGWLRLDFEGRDAARVDVAPGTVELARLFALRARFAGWRLGRPLPSR
jgi:hypothetical protein